MQECTYELLPWNGKKDTYTDTILIVGIYEVRRLDGLGCRVVLSTYQIVSFRHSKAGTRGFKKTEMRTHKPALGI